MEPIQAKSLEMARYFVDFCRRHHLLCYLCGGGAIGSLRHQGFIPWDDDLDFFMPRADYEKLIRLWPQEADPRYYLSHSNQDYLDRNLFITIRDRQTTCVKPYQVDLDLPHGLALDIIPLDYAPKSAWKQKIQKIWALIYALYCAQTVPENHGKLMTWGSRILLGMVPSRRMRYRIWTFAQDRMTRTSRQEAAYWVELCSGPYYMQKCYPLVCFESALDQPFEDGWMPIPVGYDAYLREAFGDYMTPPPIQDQVPHHDALILDLDRPYIDYEQEIGALK